MSRSTGRFIPVAAFMMVAVTVGAVLSPAGGIVVQPDPQPVCTVPPATFASWFVSGTPAPNGVVKEANGVAFLPNSLCSFYQWSQQMFLWATSPAPPSYGGGAHIFDSPTFYDVSPPDALGNRTFVPHVVGVPRIFGVRFSKPDAHMLQVLVDKKGRLLEIVPAQFGPHNLRLIMTGGRAVEIQNVRLQSNGRPVFIDRTGKPVQNPRPLLQVLPNATLQQKATFAAPVPAKPRVLSKAALSVQAKALNVQDARVLQTVPQAEIRSPALLQRALSRPLLKPTVRVNEFIINGRPIFIDQFGNPVEVEQGQADGSVLMAQNGSLVYYAMMVNDVYAYLLTGQKQTPTAINLSHFPTSQSDLNQITAFATAHGTTFPDPNALAVELKTSWIDVAGLTNASSYITTTAQVPVYTKSASQWVPTGAVTTKTLALVGMHVVGSVNQHPELIWATFEHKNNSPDATYTYNSTSGLKTITEATSGTWAFCCTSPTGPFNARRQKMVNAPQPNTIAAVTGSIGASDTLRMKAWGTGSDDPNVTSSNTQVISIDHNMATLFAGLSGTDVRSNYILTGATWTLNGAIPSPASNQAGTTSLQNSTLETYVQGNNTTVNGSNHGLVMNCFDCHASATNGFDTSHIYPDLKPLNL